MQTLNNTGSRDDLSVASEVEESYIFLFFLLRIVLMLS